MGPLCCDQPETLTQGYYPRVDSMAIKRGTSVFPKRYLLVLRYVGDEASADESLSLYFQQASSTPGMPFLHPPVWVKIAQKM